MLTDITIRTAKPTAKPYKLTDERGLYLLVTGTAKLWRFDYRFEGRRKTLALGQHPEITLKKARDKREAARTLLADGVDPAAARAAEKRSQAGAESFEAVAREWLVKFGPTLAPSYSSKLAGRLDNDLIPWVGKRPIAEITAPELLAVLRRIESRGKLETAHRCLQLAGRIFRYAVATGRAERDPTGDLRGAIPPAKTQHFAAVTDPAGVGDLLRTIDSYPGSFVVRCALRLAPLVFVRPGELRTMKWADVDGIGDAPTWRYRQAKTGADLIVPLSVQAMAILEEIRPLTQHGV